MVVEDVNAYMMFIIRLVASFVVIVFMMVLFFSFRVSVVNDDMQRFDMELADSLSSSDIAASRSIFSAEKLFALQPDDPLFSRMCEYEYTAEIEANSVKACSSNDECADYCKDILNADDGGNYDCTLMGRCECKGSGGWHYSYYWKLGSEPNSTYHEQSQTFPVAVEAKSGAIIPSTLTIKSYDSFLSRITCISKKSYETKQNVSVFLDVYKMEPPLPKLVYDSKIAGEEGQICIFVGNEKEDCRKIDVPLTETNLEETIKAMILKNQKHIVAYPLKTDATCGQLQEDSSFIAGKDDNVQTILLCPSK